MGQHSRCERHLLAAFYAVHRNQPFAGQCERCGERVTAAFRRAKLLDRRLSRRHFSGVGEPVRQCDDLEIRGRHLVRFPDHFIRFRPVGILSFGDKLHGLERGEVSVLRIEKEESVIPVFEVDPVLEFALRAVVVRAFRAFRPPACRSCCRARCGSLPARRPAAPCRFRGPALHVRSGGTTRASRRRASRDR